MNHRAQRRSSPSRPTLVGLSAIAVVLAVGCSDSGSASGPGTTDAAAVVTTRPAAGTGVDTVSNGPARRPHLVEFGDCDELVSWNREQMLQRVTPYGLDDGYVNAPWDARPASTTAAGAPAATAPEAFDQAAPETTAPGVAAPPEDGGATSGTNTQEAGVDEADVTETDGTYVYSLLDGRLRSVDVAARTIVSDVAEPLPDAQMILFGERLLVVGQDWSSGDPDSVVARYSVVNGVVTLLGRSHLEGTLISTRSVDGLARIVLSLPLAARLPFVQPTDSHADDDALDQNRAVIKAATAADLLPRAYEEGSSGGASELHTMLDCSQVGHPEQFSGFNTVWVATLDLRNPADPAGGAVVGAAGVIADAQTVYASTGHLYVATVAVGDDTGNVVPMRPAPLRTEIHSFTLAADDGADYDASGAVEGTVLNSYAMSEFDGHLRIATTTDAGGFGNARESGIHVFEQRADVLVEVGTLGGLGRTEQIQAVRYADALAYVVTFRQTDPLFVVDLSDPAAPRLVGQLQVPGYSTYLHPVEGGLLLAVGFEATADGRTTGTQLSLFDVADPSAPALLQTVHLGASSEATFDPHAFLFWPATGSVVVPRELDCTDQPDTAQDCASGVVAHLGDRTLTEQGRLEQWFPIRRSLVVGGELVTVSAHGVRIHDLATLAALADLAFAGPVDG